VRPRLTPGAGPLSQELRTGTKRARSRCGRSDR
jgi:hypothetical protein